MGDMEGAVEVQSVDLDRDGLYFIAKDGDAWVYVDAEDRLVKVFSSLRDALAYGLHVAPEEITNVELIKVSEDVARIGRWETKVEDYVLRVCIGNECIKFKAWVD
jgi:hypothetical protein